MHHQNPLRKLKDRPSLCAMWVLGAENPADHVTVVVSSWLAVKCFGSPVLCDNEGTGRTRPLGVLCPAHEGHDVLHYLVLKHWLQHKKSLCFWRNKITFSFVFKLDLFKNKHTQNLIPANMVSEGRCD